MRRDQVIQGSFRIFILTLLCAALSVTASALDSVNVEAGNHSTKRMLSLPAGKRIKSDAVKPATASTTHAAGAKDLSLRVMPADSNTVNVNPTSLFTGPFVHDYSEGGLYGDYSIGSTVHGDFRHQNVQDVVALSIDGILTLMTNDGKGNFTNAYKNLSQTATWVNIDDAFVIDLDGDGWLDVLAFDSYSAAYVVWFNKGDGTFKDAVRTAIPFPGGMAPGNAYIRPNGMAVGDLDGDGKPDIMLAFSASDYTDGLYLMYLAGLKGNGDGTFQAAVFNNALQFSAQTYIGGISLAKMNGGSNLDVVVKFLQGGSYSSNGTEGYTVVPGSGAIKPGKWTMPTNWVTASTTRGGSFMVRDIDGDGKPDVLSAPGTAYVYLYKGDGAGNLGAAQTLITAPSYAYGMTLGDYNNDGYADVALFSDGAVRIYNGAADGAFASTFSQEYPGGDANTHADTAFDLNGDGIDDFIWAEPQFNNLFSYRNNGDGTFNSYTALRPANTSTDGPNNSESGTNFLALGKGDFNGDGLTDLLVEEGSSYIDIALNNGKDGFNFTRAIDATLYNSLGLEVVEPIHRDFDGDGYDDVVFITGSGVAVGLSDGKGGFKNFVASPLGATLTCTAGTASAGDLDGDGKLDIVLAYAGDASCYASTTTTTSGYFILKGDSKGGFTSSFYPAGSGVYTARLADLNSDGKLDIVLMDSAGINSSIDVVPGDGTIAPPVSNLKTLYTSSMRTVIADFNLTDVNGDNLPDLTVSEYNMWNSSAYDISLLAGSGNFAFKDAVKILDGDYATSLDYVDMNHDGHLDLLATLYPYSKKVNGLAILRGNGDGTFQTPDIYPTPIDSGSNFDELLLTGSYHKASSHDIALGGGDEYVPSVIFYNAESTALTLSTNRNTANLGDNVSLYAQLGDFSSNNASGSVVFTNNGSEIGSSTISGELASLTIDTLPVGTNQIVASYAGDGTHAAVKSDALNIVIAQPASDFSLNSGSSSISLTEGGSAQATFTVAANAELAGTVQFSCLGLPSTLQCTFTPSSISISPSASQSTSLTVTAAKHVAENRGNAALPITTVAFALCLPLLLGKRRRMHFLCLLLLPLGMMGMVAGCGGSGTKAAQTYHFTVVAQATTTSATVSHSIPMQVVVK